MTEDISIESHCCWLIGIGVKEENCRPIEFGIKSGMKRGEISVRTRVSIERNINCGKKIFTSTKVRIKHHEKYHETSIFETNLIARRIIC